MAQLSGDISNEGILDLTWAQTAEDLKGITSLSNIGIIKAPANLMGVISSIPRTNIGMIFAVKPGLKKEMTGQMRITGDFLAKGDPETTLLLVGQFVIVPPVESIGFKEISVLGQLVLPRGSEGVIGSKLEVAGQAFYVSWDQGTPRVMMNNESVGQAFLDVIKPEPWVVMRDLAVEDDVTSEMLRSKVTEIVLVGKIIAPKALVPILQAITTEKFGSIVAKEDPAANKEE